MVLVAIFVAVVHVVVFVGVVVVFVVVLICAVITTLSPVQQQLPGAGQHPGLHGAKQATPAQLSIKISINM
jgi:hypothetical protein